ncbi:DUF559 domain-containing protein [Paludisphaera soli]|uniref:DUF559 domain-containing protein n=1 Tax=Paludisphaera soli TaxID=2712865 RepID=UPI0013EB3929|nr:DUF559 domain-containing protein [Paludisphaera soli]
MIELDGDSHVGRANDDRIRQAWLESQHLQVVRISNDDVVQDLGAVIEAILAYGRRVPGGST